MESPDYFLARLPIAIANIAEGKISKAQSAYESMGEQGERAKSIATTGLADIALLRGDFLEAASLLRAGRTSDLAFGNSQGYHHKGIYLARALAALGQKDEAIAILDESVTLNNDLSHLVPAALLYIEVGLSDRARAIQQQLSSAIQERPRAAADAISGALALSESDYVRALDAFNASLQRVDFWLTRFWLGKAYALSGNHAEALGEFELALERIGESSALFLDDIPTFHFHAPLYYWLGRTKQDMGSLQGAAENLGKYLSLRVITDETFETIDARRRMDALPAGA